MTITFNKGKYFDICIAIETGEEMVGKWSLLEFDQSIDLSFVRRVIFVINCSLKKLPDDEIEALRAIFVELERLRSLKFICRDNATIAPIPLDAIGKFSCLVAESDQWKGTYNFFDLSSKFKNVVFRNVNVKCFTPQDKRFFKMIRIFTSDAKQYETYMERLGGIRFRYCKLQLKKKVQGKRRIIACFEKKFKYMADDDDDEQELRIYSLFVRFSSKMQYELFKNLVIPDEWSERPVKSFEIDINYKLNIFKKVWDGYSWLLKSTETARIEETNEDRQKKSRALNEIEMTETYLVAKLYDGEYYDLWGDLHVYTNMVLVLGSKYEKVPAVVMKFSPLILKSPVEELTITDKSGFLWHLFKSYGKRITTEEGEKRKALHELQVADIYTDNPGELSNIFGFESIEKVTFNVDKSIRYKQTPPSDEWTCEQKHGSIFNHYIYYSEELNGSATPTESTGSYENTDNENK